MTYEPFQIISNGARYMLPANNANDGVQKHTKDHEYMFDLNK